MIENKIEIEKKLGSYYIVVNNTANDEDIIKYLGITNEFYFNKGIEFGGEYIEEETLYFHYKRDINKFKKWLEKNIDSFLVAKALVNNK
jgi:hypothetical protein